MSTQATFCFRRRPRQRSTPSRFAKLAGLTDPDYSGTEDNSTAVEHKQWAIDLWSACARCSATRGGAGRWTA